MGYREAGCSECRAPQGEEAVMKTLQTSFGEVEYDPNRVVHFPGGLIGFEQLREFVVLPTKQKIGRAHV